MFDFRDYQSYLSLTMSIIREMRKKVVSFSRHSQWSPKRATRFQITTLCQCISDNSQTSPSIAMISARSCIITSRTSILDRIEFPFSLYAVNLQFQRKRVSYQAINTQPRDPIVDPNNCMLITLILREAETGPFFSPSLSKGRLLRLEQIRSFVFFIVRQRNI